MLHNIRPIHIVEVQSIFNWLARAIRVVQNIKVAGFAVVFKN